MRGAKVEVKCARCKEPFLARVADRKRGWGKFCSKSCKAIRQEGHTGNYHRYKQREDRRENPYDYEDGPREFSDAHLFSNEDHDCNKD